MNWLVVRIASWLVLFISLTPVFPNPRELGAAVSDAFFISLTPSLLTPGILESSVSVDAFISLTPVFRLGVTISETWWTLVLTRADLRFLLVHLTASAFLSTAVTIAPFDTAATEIIPLPHPISRIDFPSTSSVFTKSAKISLL